MRKLQTNNNRSQGTAVVNQPLTPEQRNQIFFNYLRKYGPGKACSAEFRTLMDCILVYGPVKGVRLYINICTRRDLTTNLNILAEFSFRMSPQGWEAMTDFIVMATNIKDEQNGSEVLYV